MAIDKNNLSALTFEFFLISLKAIGTTEGLTDIKTMSEFCTTGTFSKIDSAPSFYKNKFYIWFFNFFPIKLTLNASCETKSLGWQLAIIVSPFESP